MRILSKIDEFSALRRLKIKIVIGTEMKRYHKGAENDLNTRARSQHYVPEAAPSRCVGTFKRVIVTGGRLSQWEDDCADYGYI